LKSLSLQIIGIDSKLPKDPDDDPVPVSWRRLIPRTGALS